MQNHTLTNSANWYKLCTAVATFDCSNCHLAWLIRDNRHFLPSIFGGQCSNGTTFEELIPSGFVDCPVMIQLIIPFDLLVFLIIFLLHLHLMANIFQSFVCPLGYDGYYADPSTCSSYYICRTNVAYHYVIIYETSPFLFYCLLTI